MRYSVLFFDADNTLFDFDTAQKQAFEKAMIETCGQCDPGFLQVYERVNKKYWAAFERGEVTQSELKEKRFGTFFDEIGIEADSAAMNSLYLQRLSECSLLLDGAAELVEQLAKTHRLLLITNGLKTVQRPRFQASPITVHFEAIVISDELGIAKPHAGIFDAAFELMGHPAKEDVLMIGDSLSSDMLGGIDFGIDTCWFNPTEKRNDSLSVTYEVTALSELIGIAGWR